MKTNKSIYTILFLGMLIASCKNEPKKDSEPQQVAEYKPTPVPEEPIQEVQIVKADSTSSKIKIALLLDTSSSMDGLIDQAKSQLWKIINQLALASKNEKYSQVEIALYEYGNDNLKAEKGYVKQVLNFTNNLDSLSENLFSLTTNGGDEYCAQVLSDATNDLNWNVATSDLNLIFICGNEPFDQDYQPYSTSCANAVERNIIINTIYCGAQEDGIHTLWKDGADKGNGKYLNIEMNEATVYIESPYDLEISSYNDSLNNTYVYYGIQGLINAKNQTTQDYNSMSYGMANNVSRIVSKSSHIYNNASWDLIDAAKEKGFDITKIDKTTLPSKLAKLSSVELKNYIYAYTLKRAAVIKKIQELNIKRQAYIDDNSQNDNSSLSYAMLAAIKEQAETKGFSF